MLMKWEGKFWGTTPSKMIAGRHRRSVRINLWLIYTGMADVLGWVLRIISINGLYLTCFLKLNLNEYQNGVRVWSVSVLYLKSWIWMSVRVASVSEAYLNCIWRLNLYEYQDSIRVWSVFELYLKAESEWVSEWLPCLERIWTVSES